ncbi:hypothetical protein ACEPAH_7436 [Sanghuangporus vaninii]
MQFFNKIAIVAMLAAFVAATPITETDKRQLGDILPSIVCLMGPLASAVPSGMSIVACATGETCTALDIPIIGGLLPIGVSLAARSP